MGFFNLFPTARELKRLAKEVTFWRSRCSALEKELKIANALLLERDFAWADRFLTSKVGTFAINDEVQAKVFARTQPKPDLSAERAAFLEARRREVYSDAKEAGVGEAEANERWRQLEPDLITEWQVENNFG